MSTGKKYDSGKPQWSLLPYDALEDAVRAFEEGLEKYERDSWKYVEDAETRYSDALMRHFTAYRNGEVEDEKSGLHPLAHLIASALIVLWHSKNNDSDKKTLKILGQN